MNIQKILGLISLFTLVPLALQSQPTVYIALGSGNGVAVVDSKTDTVLKTYSGVENPHGLVITPDGEYLIAGSLSEDVEETAKKNKLNSKLFLIHPIHNHVMQTIAVEGFSHHQAITPDGRYVLSTHPTRNHVSIVDVEDSRQIKLIKTGDGPNYIVVTKDGKYAYVSNSSSGNVQEIRISDWMITRTIASGPSPEHIILSKNDQTLYVSNARKGDLSIINLNKPNERKVFKIGKNLHGLDISDDGQRLFISSKKEDKLFSFDLKTTKKTQLSLSPSPYHLNTITGTGKVYISSSKQPLIWVVDQKTLKLINTFTLPAGEGHQMVIAPQD